MKKLILSLAIVLFTTVFSTLKAQQVVLSVDSVFFPYNGVFYGGPTYTIDIRVSNQGNAPYNGSFELMYLTDKMIANLDSPAIFYPNQQLILNPANILQFSVDSFAFDTTANFKVGGNIVVVWPRGTSGATFIPDTFRTEVFVWPYHAGLTEQDNNLLVSTYPNPVSNFLIIKGKDSGAFVEEVRICDLLGNCVLKEIYSQNPVNVSALKNGIYMLRIKMRNGEIVWKKIIVSR